MRRTTKPTRDLATRRHSLEGEPPYKRGPGQPSHYRSWMNDEVIELGKQGKDRTQIAAALNITKMTLYGWMKSFPEFYEAMELAWTHMYTVHLQQLEDLITGSDRINKAALIAIIFKLKNTCHWADRQVVEDVSEPKKIVHLKMEVPPAMLDKLLNMPTEEARKLVEMLPTTEKIEGEED